MYLYNIPYDCGDASARINDCLFTRNSLSGKDLSIGMAEKCFHDEKKSLQKEMWRVIKKDSNLKKKNFPLRIKIYRVDNWLDIVDLPHPDILANQKWSSNVYIIKDKAELKETIFNLGILDSVSATYLRYRIRIQCFFDYNDIWSKI